MVALYYSQFHMINIFRADFKAGKVLQILQFFENTEVFLHIKEKLDGTKTSSIFQILFII